MLIRDAVQTDRPSIAAVHAASWRDAYAPFVTAAALDERLDRDMAVRWREQPLAGRDFVLVAHDEAILGFILVQRRTAPYVESLHVHPRYRSQGIGRRLLAVAFDRLLADGETTASLSVVSDHRRAIDFYRRLGGEPGPVRVETLRGEPITYTTICWAELPVLTTSDP